MGLSEIVSPEEKTRRSKILRYVRRFCASKRHPYEQRVLGYNIRGVAFTQCTNCLFVTERRATQEELDRYYNGGKRA